MNFDSSYKEKYLVLKTTKYQLLKALNRPVNGIEYKRLSDSLERLSVCFYYIMDDIKCTPGNHLIFINPKELESGEKLTISLNQLSTDALMGGVNNTNYFQLFYSEYKLLHKCPKQQVLHIILSSAIFFPSKTKKYKTQEITLSELIDYVYGNNSTDSRSVKSKKKKKIMEAMDTMTEKLKDTWTIIKIETLNVISYRVKRRG